jgi:hypothetical protein
MHVWYGMVYYSMVFIFTNTKQPHLIIFSWPTRWRMGTMVTLVRLSQTLRSLPRGRDNQNKTMQLPTSPEWRESM